jgi:hypothetical protein
VSFPDVVVAVPRRHLRVCAAANECIHTSVDQCLGRVRCFPSNLVEGVEPVNPYELRDSEAISQVLAAAEAGVARTRVERAAAELLAAAGPVTVPVDVERLPGAQLLWQRLDRMVSGLLLRVDDSAVLAVNESHHPWRQRFTIAHELGAPDVASRPEGDRGQHRPRQPS